MTPAGPPLSLAWPAPCFSASCSLPWCPRLSWLPSSPHTWQPVLLRVGGPCFTFTCMLGIGATLEGRLPQPLPLGRLTVYRGRLSKSSQTRALKGGLESWERSDRRS